MKGLKKEYFTINNITMEVVHKKVIDMPIMKKYCTYQILDNCYNKPSYTKKNIYYDLCYNLVNHNEDIGEQIDFGIASYNKMIFTFNSDYIDKSGIFKQIHITPAHNYIYIYDL